MQIIQVELLNDKALRLLQELEQLDILRLVIPQKQTSKEKQKRKWAGTISSKTAQDMLQYTDKSRQEWERNI